ncbi:MAG TPA: hypothetical protein VLA43_18755, partial [Longimicrobiales bacterium]|nr:hypothetical protein [Longimicrobiales bacterium]
QGAGSPAQGASAPTSLERDVRGAEAEVANVGVADSVAADESAKVADLWAAARERRDQERPAAQRALPPTAVAADPLVSGALEPRPEQARRVVNLAGSAVSLRDQTAADAGASLVVPGLSVVSVTWLDEPGLAGAVRALQLMEGGDTVELVHLPAGVDPSLLPTRGDGWTQLLAPRNGGWLVLRGQTSAEVLSGLLRRLGGGD